MKTKLGSFFIVAVSIAMVACTTNKVDSVLNKEEKALDKYEAKIKTGKATVEDFTKLQSELNMIALDIKDVSIEKDITPQQQQRAEQLAERYADIMMDNVFEVDAGQ